MPTLTDHSFSSGLIEDRAGVGAKKMRPGLEQKRVRQKLRGSPGGRPFLARCHNEDWFIKQFRERSRMAAHLIATGIAVMPSCTEDISVTPNSLHSPVKASNSPAIPNWCTSTIAFSLLPVILLRSLVS